jgi:hypothetical protein
MAAWCRRYRRVKASSSPRAARRNRTSSLSGSAILISPDKTFCALSCINSRRALKKFPFDRLSRTDERVSRTRKLKVLVFTMG